MTVKFGKWLVHPEGVSLPYLGTDYSRPLAATTRPCEGGANMIRMTDIAEVYGTRLRVEPVAPTAVLPTRAHAWRRCSSVLDLGAALFSARVTDNSTGVSAVERRRR